MASNSTTRRVRFGDDKSSRSSTVGGSSTSSSIHSGSDHSDYYTDPNYNVVALQETLNVTIRERDESRQETQKCKAEARKYKDAASTAKARVSALENTVSNLENEIKDHSRDLEKLREELELLQEENDKLKKRNQSLKKKLGEQQDGQSSDGTPSTPDRDSNTTKLRRSGSKKSSKHHTDNDEIDRLKERFDRNSPPSSNVGVSGTTHSKPPSSSKAPSSSRHRRPSMTSERPSPLYVEPYNPVTPRAVPSSPVVSSSSRRPHGQYPDYHDQGYPSRIAGMQRGTVEVPLYEDGNYHTYPLPDRSRY